MTSAMMSWRQASVDWLAGSSVYQVGFIVYVCGVLGGRQGDFYYWWGINDLGNLSHGVYI